MISIIEQLVTCECWQRLVTQFHVASDFGGECLSTTVPLLLVESHSAIVRKEACSMLHTLCVAVAVWVEAEEDSGTLVALQYGHFALRFALAA